MNIEVVSGTGDGTTQLSGFDASLADAGLHNYNLISLSSVMPAGSTVEVSGRHDQRWDVGEFVGVVIAANESTIPGETIAAGLGWATAAEGGVFYEATADTSGAVESRVRRGLSQAKSIRDGWHWADKIETRVVTHAVEDNGAAVVSAVYRPV